MISEQEKWQVNVNGQVYEASFNELVQWINESALLREDLVRRGNLRWLNAGRVPTLTKFFNAKESGDQSVFVSYTDKQEILEAEVYQADAAVPVIVQAEIINEIPVSEEMPAADPMPETEPVFQNEVPSVINPDACANHPDTPPEFVCDGCANLFCKTCPNSYGGTVKTCPMCGAMCRSISQLIDVEQKSYQFQSALSEGFGFNDFGNALAYPFKYKTSLFFGAIMFMLFSMGQLAGGFGFYMLFAAVFCIMLANALTFGVLANTIENFSKGDINLNFMPSFDDFELWHDVIHPFFLSIGVYIVSFGLLIALIVGAVWYVFSSLTSAMGQPTGAFVGETVEPGQAQNPLDQTNPFLNGQAPINPELAKNEHLLDEDEKEIMRLDGLINQHRKNQLESTIGPSAETREAQNKQMFDQVISLVGPFILLFFGALAWGFFYFPVACIVAGYTRSFGATLNPLVGFDTIKRLGSDYFKILLMSLILTVFSFAVSVVLQLVFKPFDLPGMGNLPALAFTSLITFYLSVVFSVTLGMAIYKNSDKFQMFRG